jgi:hypothetical protein
MSLIRIAGTGTALVHFKRFTVQPIWHGDNTLVHASGIVLANPLGL